MSAAKRRSAGSSSGRSETASKAPRPAARADAPPAAAPPRWRRSRSSSSVLPPAEPDVDVRPPHRLDPVQPGLDRGPDEIGDVRRVPVPGGRPDDDAAAERAEPRTRARSMPGTSSAASARVRRRAARPMAPAIRGSGPASGTPRGRPGRAASRNAIPRTAIPPVTTRTFGSFQEWRRRTPTTAATPGTGWTAEPSAPASSSIAATAPVVVTSSAAVTPANARRGRNSRTARRRARRLTRSSSIRSLTSVSAIATPVGRRRIRHHHPWCGTVTLSETRHADAGQRKTTVRSPLSRTRCSACHRTARARARHSTSRPTATSSSGLWVWSTRATSCSMIGPSSRSAVT